MITDVRVLEYEIAERRLFHRYGLEYRSRYFQLDNPRPRARVIEVGSEPPDYSLASSRGPGASGPPEQAAS